MAARTMVAICRVALTGALVVGLYYLVPGEPGVWGARLAWRTAGTVVAGLVVTWLIIRQLSAQVSDPEESPLAGPLTALIGGVGFFALAAFVTAGSDPAHFVDPPTQTGAPSLPLAPPTTVGDRHVHPGRHGR